VTSDEPFEIEPTQVQYPGRAVLRTVVQAAVGLMLVVPFVVAELGLSTAVPWVAGALAAAGVTARLMAIPQVNAWLERWIGPLGATKV
jgi:hypothetical protein